MRKGKKWIAEFLAMTMAMQILGTDVPIKVMAENSEVIFHDFEGDSLNSNASGSLTKEDIYQGEQALKYDKTGEYSGWNVEITAKNDSVDISKQSYITFWLKDSGENNLEVKLVDGNGKESKVWTEEKSVSGKWTLISVPLSSFPDLENLDLTNITKVAFYEWNEGTYYIDDIKFVQELSSSEDNNPMNGMATWLQNFETDDLEATFDKAPKGVEVSVEDSAGCEKDGTASKGLVYRRTESADPSSSSGSVIIKSEKPVNTTGLRYLIFYIKDTQGSNTLKVSLIDKEGKETNFGWTSLKTVKGKWKQYYILLDDLKGDIDFTQISGIRIGQWNSGTYYIDNVYFDNYLFTGTPDSDNNLPTLTEGEVKASVDSSKITKATEIELIADPNASIYYTVDGTDPKKSSEYLYKKVITISKNAMIKAMAVKDGKEGKIYTFTYEFALPYAVTATNKPGSYTDQVVVEFRTENDKDLIYYTTDGTQPVRGGKNTKQFIKPMLVTEDTTFKAIGYNSQSGGETLETSTFEYKVTNSGKTAVPVFSKLEGTYGDAIDVELTADGDIYYTVDGTEPTTASTKYELAIKVENDMTIRAIAVKNDVISTVGKASYIINKEETPFLKADGKVLKDDYGTGDIITLRGTNAGGWLVTEDWQCPTNAKDQLTAQNVFTERFGKETAQELINLYQDGWWTEEDFDLVKQEGMNVLRLPITYFEMLNEDGTLKESAFDRLEWFVENCEKRGLYVLIDMHGAVGSQNGKDHSGDISNPNVGNFYGNEENILKTIKLWEVIAEKYKDNLWVCGYDLLNEPSAVGTIQFDVYDRIYDAIRAIDKNHPIYIQSIWEPTHLPDPSYYGWQNVVYEYHFYGWNVEKDAEGQYAFIQTKVDMVNEDTNYNVPLLVGEFSFFSNTESWKAMDIFEQQGWSYTSWTFKVTDGGEGSSWGIYTGSNANKKININNDSKEDIQKKWSAENLNTKTGFTRNAKYADILKKYYANNEKNKMNMTDAEDIELLEKLTLKPKETAELNAKVVPENTAYKTLYFSTSDSSIADVNAEGIVTAKAKGTAVITVTNLYGMKKICTVTVEPSSDGNNQGGNNQGGNTSGGNTSGGNNQGGNTSEGNNQEENDTPADTNIPTDTNTQKPTDTEKPADTQKPTDIEKVPSKVTVNDSVYKVTSKDDTKTVEYTGTKNDKKSNITIPSTIKINGENYKVTVIKANAFKDNKKIKQITIGKNIKKIGKNAFKNCKNLKKIVIKTKNLTSKNVGKNVFKGISKKAVIKVPKAKVKAYKKLIIEKGGAYKKTEVKVI